MNTRSFHGKGNPGTRLPPVPGCTLGQMRACGGMSCDGCGWNRDEIARRKTLIKRNGLTRDPHTGLRRLVVTEKFP